MWILSLEWLSLAITVFWVAGAWKRLQRLRTTCKSAFAALDAQFVLALEWLRTCARAEAGEGAEALAQHARHALLPSGSEPAKLEGWRIALNAEGRETSD